MVTSFPDRPDAALPQALQRSVDTSPAVAELAQSVPQHGWPKVQFFPIPLRVFEKQNEIGFHSIQFGLSEEIQQTCRKRALGSRCAR
jgi:hypothetical protein